MATNPYLSEGEGGYRTVSDEADAVDTDGNGDFTHTFSDLKIVESGADVHASAEGGYVASIQSTSDNQVTVRIFEGNGGTTSGEMAAVTNGNGVTNVDFLARGY